MGCHWKCYKQRSCVQSVLCLLPDVHSILHYPVLYLYRRVTSTEFMPQAFLLSTFELGSVSGRYIIYSLIFLKAKAPGRQLFPPATDLARVWQLFLLLTPSHQTGCRGLRRARIDFERLSEDYSMSKRKIVMIQSRKCSVEKQIGFENVKELNFVQDFDKTPKLQL